ncbi:MAG: GerW family sporulation protein [Oscillospiraceae bacterium]|jgi:sporulation protein YtfJ|nr:GerW family sporulation protein [Oscillospiraceae bacterium]
MSEHPIGGLMNSTMQKIKEMVDVDNIIGNPIKVSESIIAIPISKVTYGFASGGSEFETKKEKSKELFGGGSGAGVNILPVAVLVVNGDDVRLMQVEPFQNSIEKIIDMTPDLIEKIKSFLDKKDKNKK